MEFVTDRVGDAITALDQLDPVLAQAVRQLQADYAAAVRTIEVQARAQKRYADVMRSRRVLKVASA
jgi:hypothetical protein